MSSRVDLENYHAAHQYAQHYHNLPTEEALTRWLSNNKISIPGRSDTFVPFRPAILAMLSYHELGAPMPPPLSRGRLKRTKRRKGTKRSRSLNLRKYKQR